MSVAVPTALYSSWYTQIPRGLAAVASLAAAIAMGISRQSIPDPEEPKHSIKIEAKDISCYMYFLGINAIVGAYSLLVLPLPKSSLLWQSILASDMVLAMLLASINSATLGMFYMEMKGNTHADWSPVCDLASSYCNSVMTAVIAGYISFGMYFFDIIACLCMALNPLLLQGPDKNLPLAPPKA